MNNEQKELLKQVIQRILVAIEVGYYDTHVTGMRFKETKEIRKMLDKIF